MKAVVIIIVFVVVVDTLTHYAVSKWSDQALVLDLSGTSPTLRPRNLQGIS